MRPATNNEEDFQQWRTAPLHELVKHIVGDYHRYTRIELARLESLTEEAILAESEHQSLLFQIRSHLHHLAEDLRHHLAQEEQVLFPALLAAPESRKALDPIRLLEEEHGAVEELLINIRTLTADYTPPANAHGLTRQLLQGLQELEDNLYRHLYLENHILFPRAFAGMEK